MRLHVLISIGVKKNGKLQRDCGTCMPRICDAAKEKKRRHVSFMTKQNTKQYHGPQQGKKDNP